MIRTVGAVASVAGFALVLRRLGRLEQNLNQAMDRLRADVERVHLRLNLLAMADLRAAWEQLAGARQTGPGGRRHSSMPPTAPSRSTATNTSP